MNNKKLVWIELIKAIALVWIFVNHTSENLFGFPMFANPIIGWPPLSERVAQLHPLGIYGLWNLPINLFRYIGWTGDQGVQLFIIASGFGLTWGFLIRQAGKPLAIGKFYLRRAERIFPLWWGVHILFILIWILTGWGLSIFNPASFVSLLGIRVTPGLLYYFSPAWWYIWLIIQLYLVYPLLWEGLRRFGPLKLLLASSLIAFAVRGIGLYVFEGYLDAWARGAIFITRLPEFVFGISLAAWMFFNPEQSRNRLHSLVTWVLAIVVYVIGTLLSLTLPGMVVAPFLLGVGAFIFLYLLLDKLISILPSWALAPGIWTGEHSYSLYLVHNPVILALVSTGFILSFQTAGRVVLSILLTIGLALVLEWSVDFTIRVIRRLVEKIGASKTVLVGGIVGVTLILLVISAELLVRRVDPQEVLGWGERSSLEPDSEFGWKLIPSKSTQLRWLSYDYLVEANSLGFPGPEYPVKKDVDTYRILVTGDAFTSAEGVDTSQAWPRLLETELAAQVDGKKIEVLNFAMTGYGPNQYAAIVNRFASIYKPDIIIVETFVNDFQDALWSIEEFHYSIGFGLSAQDSFFSILKFEHLRRWVQINIFETIKEIIRGQPSSEGYFLGNFNALEYDNLESNNEGHKIVYRDFQRIKTIADQVGAKTIIFMVPAPVQVCNSKELNYYPRHVNLDDSDTYDLDLPQRSMAQIANNLNIPFYDLRTQLNTNTIGNCLYQSDNMHWTITGHQVVAHYIADVLINDGYTP